jgi:hypothetical protein
MEFFLPGIAALLLAALLVFFVAPRLGTPVLVFLSLLLLMYGVHSHMATFASEYRYSTWQEQLKLYSPFVIVGALLLTVLMYFGFLFTSGGEKALPAPNVVNSPELPPANTATNVITSTINNTLQAANKVANGASDVITNATNTVNNSVKNMNRGLNNLTNANRGVRNNNVNITSLVKNNRAS